MTDPELDAVKKLSSDIAAILKGHEPHTIGTALVITVADWLRQYHRTDLNQTQLDQLRIDILMRFLKGIAEEIGLGMEFKKPRARP